MNRPTKAATEDVRMRGFAKRHTVAAALEWLDAQLQPLDAETVPLGVASGRVLASACDQRCRCAGIRSRDDGRLRGGGGEHRRRRRLQPAVADGHWRLDAGPSLRRVDSPGEAVRVMTGAPMPRGADAVLPAEFVEEDTEVR